LKEQTDVYFESECVQRKAGLTFRVGALQQASSKYFWSKILAEWNWLGQQKSQIFTSDLDG